MNMDISLPECTWMERDVPNKELNGIHRVVGSHMEYPDCLSDDGGEVLITACGQGIRQWWFLTEPAVFSGALEVAKRTGIQLCPKCLDVHMTAL